MKSSIMMLAALACAAPAAAQTLKPRDAARDVMVIAHRGCWEGGAPEVSVAAIQACQAIQPDLVEVDVRKTRDGQFVLMHDASVDRTTNGTGAIAEMSAAQFRALRLRAGAGGPLAPLTSERPPTLEEGLRAAKGKFTLHLHLYVDPDPAIGALIRRMGMAGQVTTWAGDKPAAGAVRPFALHGTVTPIPIVKQCAAPAAGCWTAPIATLHDYAPYRPAGFYVIPNGSAGSEPAQAFIHSAAAAARPAGARIMASTLFELDALPPEALRAAWGKLIDLGVDMIMTDHPATLLDYLRAKPVAATARLKANANIAR